jgi:hypothetical protein
VLLLLLLCVAQRRRDGQTWGGVAEREHPVVLLGALCDYSQLKVTLRPPVYRQSVRPGAKPLEVHDQGLFSVTEPLRSQ